MISPDGTEAKVYVTQQSYAAIGQLAQLLAREASAPLPDHPQVHSSLSYAPIEGITPSSTVSLPGAGAAPSASAQAPRG